ncbi:hypothetical protein PLCT2_02217 [Planctomycetaceae bacterium]|nr:hypothetical protein PLCT2_02217 [Planctomycetaceae bacterium]
MRHALLAALLLSIAACSGPKRSSVAEIERGSQPVPVKKDAAPQPEKEPAPEKQPEPEKKPEVKPATVKRGKLEDPAEPEQKRALDIIERVTGLKFKTPMPVYIYTPEDLAEEMKDWGDGYVPENVMGFYRPDTKTFYLVPKVAGNARSFGLRVHEATHALQDQHFDLIKLHESVKTSDANDALTALIEGHAVQVMIDGLSDLSPHVAKIAEVREPTDKHNPNAWSTVFYYAMGAKFVQHLIKNAEGYPGVHKAFARVPASSEQILHPEKYLGELDLPHKITPDFDAIKTELPQGWKVKDVDTLGEWQTRLWIMTSETAYGSAEDAAAGWGGDLEITLVRDDKPEAWLKLWITSWDSEAEADEMSEALALMGTGVHYTQEGDKILIVRSSEALGTLPCNKIERAMGKAKIE